MQTINDLYASVNVPMAADYFDCKMMNGLAEELKSQLDTDLAEARKLKKLLALCRDSATRYLWSIRLKLVNGRICATLHEWRSATRLGRQFTREYLENLHGGAV